MNLLTQPNFLDCACGNINLDHCRMFHIDCECWYFEEEKCTSKKLNCIKWEQMYKASIERSPFSGGVEGM